MERGRGRAEADALEFGREFEFEFVHCRAAAGDAGSEDVSNGREMVVTRMECLRSALSGTPAGMKHTRASNGRCDGSGGGREVYPRRSVNDADIEDGLDELRPGDGGV